MSATNPLDEGSLHVPAPSPAAGRGRKRGRRRSRGGALSNQVDKFDASTSEEQLQVTQKTDQETDEGSLPVPAPSPTAGRGRGRGRRRSRGGALSNQVDKVDASTSEEQLQFTQETDQKTGVGCIHVPAPLPAAGRGRGRGRGDASSKQVGKVGASTSVELQRQSTLTPSTTTLAADLANLQLAQKTDQKPDDVPKEGKPVPVNDLPLSIPHRPVLREGGKSGQLIKVETNYFPLTIAPKYETAIHYDVTIIPDKPKRSMRSVWEAFRHQFLRNVPIAFDDAKNAYTPKLLNNGQDIAGEVEVRGEDETAKSREYRVVMKIAAEVNLRTLFDYMKAGGRTSLPQEALQCIDVVMRNVTAVRFIRVDRSFFSPPQGEIVQLGDGLEMWHGHFQSTVIGWKPFLNVDVAHKGFPKPQPVVNFMVQLARDNPNYRQRDATEHNLVFDQDFCKAIRQFLKGLKISYQILQQSRNIKRTFRINGLVEPPDYARFIIEDGKQMTVSEYFRTQKNYNIRLPNIPCLHVGPPERKIYVPAELCTILPGQVVNRKLNDIETSKMVCHAATSTQVRKEKNLESVDRINFNADPCVSAFGLSIGDKFESVRARVLDPPQLQYAGRTVTPMKGVWKASEFKNPAILNAWTVFNLSPRNICDNDIEHLVTDIMTSARQLGMKVAQVHRPYETLGRPNFDQLKYLFEKYKSMKIIFVIFNECEPDIYSKIKRVAELDVGCLTQCIKSKTMSKLNPATINNILLKVNAKLNGLNHTIATISRPPCLKAPCMIMGAVLSHPSPDRTDIPSVAAVTASCDADAVFQYNFCWRLQPPRQEIINDLESIVEEHLRFFRNRVNQIPQRIIFFRDGVSEGQFREVMNAEVQAIRNACGRMGSGNYKPPITFLVVQKRHHTRFFPTNPRESDDKNLNVRAGTVVDTDITHPTDIEYYLVSHASIQGVARPTKYRVLWDDFSMSEDELEQLTYYLCHMFSRCTRSVSYPAPTYYAHLAAFRARVYLEGQSLNLDRLDHEQALRVIRDELRKEKPMFFV